jgi:FixJ family two-component response regulator
MDISPERTVVKIVDCRGPLCVVDDDESMRWSITTLLDSLDFDSHGFSGGQEFLDSGLANACVCLISDVKMKKMSGFQMYEALTRSGLRIPVIFISGHADDDMRKKAISLGATALLDKPFNDDVLLQLVEKILATKAGS